MEEHGLDENFKIQPSKVAMQTLMESIFIIGDLTTVINNQYKIIELLNPSFNIEKLKDKNEKTRSKIVNELFTSFISKNAD